MRKVVAISLLPVVLLAACDLDKGKKLAAMKQPCTTSPSPALAQTPTLPPGFPTPAGVTFTSSTKTGPSTILTGYFAGTLDAVYAAYKSGFTAARYSLTKTENDGPDAEVDWSGGKTTGEVKINGDCATRTDLTLTIRPA